MGDSVDESPSSPTPSTSEMVQSEFNSYQPYDNPYPLDFPELLRKVVEYLGVKDVEKCRLVAKDWNNEACSVLQHKKIIVFLGIQAVKYYLEKMQSTSDFPHRNFEFQMHIGETEDAMKKFWIKFGPNIKYLDLRYVLDTDTLFQVLSKRLPKIQQLRLRYLPLMIDNSFTNTYQQYQLEQSDQAEPRQFPSLKELSIYNCPQDDTMIKSTFKDLLKAMCNLEKLFLKNIPRYTSDQEISRVARSVLQTLMDPEVILPRLKNIDFQLEVGNFELEGLIRKRFPFEELSLKLKAGVRNSILKDFLVMLSPNLTILEIIFPDEFFTNGVVFPAYNLMRPLERALHLKQLKELNLVNFKGSLTFVKKWAGLERLSVNKANTEVCDYLPLHFGPADHKLKKFQTDGTMEGEDLQNLSIYFPFLQILEVKGVNDDGLRTIYFSLPYLITLDISEGKFTDCGISGLPNHICDDFAETGIYQFENGGHYRKDLFIGSLTNLTSLKLSSEKMTDISLTFGIVDCKGLGRLTLQSPAITDAGIKKIGDKMFHKLKYLDIKNCENVTETGRIYLEDKITGIELISKARLGEWVPIAENPNRQVSLPYRPGQFDFRLDPQAVYMSTAAPQQNGPVALVPGIPGGGGGRGGRILQNTFHRRDSIYSRNWPIVKLFHSPIIRTFRVRQ